MGSPYPEPHIEDYALVSSTESAALIHRDGTIAWLCLPRFDSEAIMASLLGTEDHGAWRLGAHGGLGRSTRRYLPDTMILETMIETDTGEARVLDFMPMRSPGGTHELVRIVRGIEGVVDMSTTLRLRFSYGRERPWVTRQDGAIIATSGPSAVRISSSIDLTNIDFATEARFQIHADQQVAMMLEWFPSYEEPPVQRDPYALYRRTRRYWNDWAARCTYQGKYKEQVKRSLMVLKALTYSPSGGIVAAPTTSLPEAIGGVRNWDYRYCWLRDAVLTIYALSGSGYHEEASAWRWWLMRATAGAPDELQIMYGLRGERLLTEVTLDHLPGFAESRPVRIGNGAHNQLQLDVYGAVIAAFDAGRRAKLPDMEKVWPLERAIVDRLKTLWRKPDSGLWEVRGPPRPFVYSKLLCWLAFDRVIQSASDFDLEGPIDEWRALRDEIHADICENGYDRTTNSFVQYYGASGVDAALLRMATLGFLPADDPRILGTVKRIEEELIMGGLVYRYRSEDEVDGLPAGEGAFLACSFWLCDAYALSGRMDEAQALFERLVALANDLGLLAEEYDPVARRQLGNFPQAFSHFALVSSAHTLTRRRGSLAEHLADTSNMSSPAAAQG